MLFVGILAQGSTFQMHYNLPESYLRLTFSIVRFRTLRRCFPCSSRVDKDWLENDFLRKNNMNNWNTSIMKLHHSDESKNNKSKSYRRLVFDEICANFLTLSKNRKRIKKKKVSKEFDNQKTEHIIENLPFELTNSQNKVLNEINSDLKSPSRMFRIIQGDVGSGKTIVAVLTAAIVMSEEKQVALMAPTEILAEQHYESIKEYCEKVHITCGLITSNIPQKEKNIILNELKSGEIQFIIGTHSLIQEPVKFNDLGLIIIDEQHRFGVEHRKLLIEKGNSPQVLSMTATPIPRTLSITIHGDMDISIIDELPKNRLPIKTSLIYPDKIESTYEFMKQEMISGRQCFVVYPLIDESEKLDLEAAKSGYEKLKLIFNDFKVGYINGKMNKDEIDSQMIKMNNGEINCLVATTVIEVGINIPNATVIMVENAERFGMTQLHQLRGRIGRGSKQSYCFFIQRKKTPNADKRLKIMTSTLDGFIISDEDLKMRGPGDFFGTKQHGFIKSKVVDFSNDGPIIRRARQQAFEMVIKDPKLNLNKNKKIKQVFKRKYHHMLEFIKIG